MGAAVKAGIEERHRQARLIGYLKAAYLLVALAALGAILAVAVRQCTGAYHCGVELGAALPRALLWPVHLSFVFLPPMLAFGIFVVSAVALAILAVSFWENWISRTSPGANGR